MPRALIVEILGNAKQFGAELDKAAGKTRSLGKVAGVAGLVIAGGLAVGLEKSVKAALDGQVSQAALDQALRTTHQSLTKMTPALEEAQAAARKMGFSDDEARSALAKLEVATGSTKKSVDDLGVATDIARFKHVDLEQATKMLTMAMAGSQRATKQLGFTIQPVTTAYDTLKATMGKHIDASEKAQLAMAKLSDKQATAAKVIDTVKEKLHGQAQAFSDTAAGGMAQFHAQVTHVEETLGNLLLPAVTKVAQALGSASEFLSAHSDQISKAFKTMWASVGPILVGLGQVLQSVYKIVHDNWDTIGPIVKAVGTVIKSNAKIIVDALKIITDLLTGDWSGAWKAAKDIVKSEFDAMTAVARAVLGDIGKAIGSGPSDWWNSFTQSWRSVFVTPFQTAWNDVSDWVQKHWVDIVVTIVGGLPALAWKLLLTNFGPDFVTKLQTEFGKVSTWISGTVDKWAGFIADLPSRIADFGKELFKKFTDVFGGAGVGGWVSSRVGDWAGSIAGLPGRIADFGKELFNKFTSFFANSNIVSYVSGRIDAIVGFFADMPGRVAKAVKGEAGKLGKAISDLFDGLPGFVKDILGIHSPSRVFEEIGQAIIHGAIKGIEGKAGALRDAALGAFNTAKHAAIASWDALKSLSPNWDKPGLPAGQGGRFGPGVAGGGGGLVDQVLAAIGWARSHGWTGEVVSGFRTYAEQAALYARYLAGGPLAAAPGTSSHERGEAVDVTDPAGFAAALASAPPNAKLFNRLGAADPVHFSVSGYDKGGWLPTGLSLAMNATGRPERVLSHREAAGVGGSVHVHFDGPVYGADADELARNIQMRLLRIQGRNPTLGFR